MGGDAVSWRRSRTGRPSIGEENSPREQLTDRALRLALGPVDLPPGAWERFQARLVADAEAAAPVHRKGDPVPALAAVASFCLLFQVFLATATGGSFAAWTGVEDAVRKVALLILNWSDTIGSYLVGR